MYLIQEKKCKGGNISYYECCRSGTFKDKKEILGNAPINVMVNTREMSPPIITMDEFVTPAVLDTTAEVNFTDSNEDDETMSEVYSPDVADDDL